MVRMGSRRWTLWAGVALVPLLVLVAMVIAGAGDDDEELARPAATPRTTTTTTAPPPPPPPPRLMPLLGFPDTAPDHPVLAVKYDNIEKARPPVGILHADVVIEEVVEGGLTRLMALFHSSDAGIVGPVRSARSTDLHFLAELGRPLFAWSGANVDFTAAIQAADLVDVGSGATGSYFREPGRPAPSNLFADPVQLREIGAAGGGTPPPAPLFAFRDQGEAIVGPGIVPGGEFHAGGVNADLRTTFQWVWDPASGRYFRNQSGTPHVDDAGEQISAVNVLVRITPYHDSGYRDTTGAVVPEATAVGEGEAWLLTQGFAQPGRWSKAAPYTPTVFTATDGTPLEVVPGQTWMEVIPPGTGAIG